MAPVGITVSRLKKPSQPGGADRTTSHTPGDGFSRTSKVTSLRLVAIPLPSLSMLVFVHLLDPLQLDACGVKHHQTPIAQA